MSDCGVEGVIASVDGLRDRSSIVPQSGASCDLRSAESGVSGRMWMERTRRRQGGGGGSGGICDSAGGGRWRRQLQGSGGRAVRRRTSP